LSIKWLLPTAKVFHFVDSINRYEVHVACEYSLALIAFNQMYQAGLFHLELGPNHVLFSEGEFNWIFQDKSTLKFLNEQPNQPVSSFLMECPIDLGNIYQLSEIPEYFDDPDKFICDSLKFLNKVYLRKEYDRNKFESTTAELELMYKIERHMHKKFSCSK
jgi:hypothetical protein